MIPIRVLRRIGAVGPPASVWMAAVFVLTALPSGLFLAFIVPPGQVPDEQAHIARADSLTHLQLIGRRFVRTLDDGYSFLDSGVLVDTALFTVSFAVPQDLLTSGRSMTRSLLHTMQSAEWTFRPELVEAPNVARYPPAFYLPTAFVLFAAKRIGASPYHAILAGRTANLALFVALGALALWLAPRPLILVPLAVPMTIGLAASFSPDALTVATTALCVALISRLLARGDVDWTVWVASVGIGCVIAQRPPLLPMVALLLLPLGGAAWRERRQAPTKLYSAALAAGIGIAWFVAAEHVAGAPFVHPGSILPGPLFAGAPEQVFRTTDASAQLDILLHDPRQFVLLPLRTLRAEWLLKVREFIGVLGLLALMLPHLLYAAWAIAVPAAVLAEVPRLPGEWQGRPLDWALALLVIVGTVELIYIALYVSWTPVGADHVEGAQGRYFLLLAAVALLAVPGLRLKFGAVLRDAVLLGLAALCLVSSVVVPIVAVNAYYLQ